MATFNKAIFFLASTLCLLSIVRIASADADDYDTFHVQGSVYCDTCRAQFVSRLSYYLEGATVKLECRHRENKTVTFSTEAKTDKNGKYIFTAHGDHEEEVCQVSLISSPDHQCGEIVQEEYIENAARVSLSANDGVASNEKRFVNPLGFLRKTALPECAKIFKEFDIPADAHF